MALLAAGNRRSDALPLARDPRKDHAQQRTSVVYGRLKLGSTVARPTGPRPTKARTSPLRRTAKPLCWRCCAVMKGIRGHFPTSDAAISITRITAEMIAEQA